MEKRKYNSNKDERKDIDNSNRDLPKRSEMDAAHGEDMIEIEKNEGRRISEMDQFTPMDGDLGDESMDLGDEIPETIKNHNYYDPAVSTGGSKSPFDTPEGLHITKGSRAGLGYGDDGYVNEDGNPEKAEEKK